MESLHSYRNPKREVGTSNWGFALIGLAMLFFGGKQTLSLWMRKVECFKWGLMDHTNRNMKDSGAESILNCGVSIQEVSEERNVSI